MVEDSQLLGQYAEHRSEAAFGELVSRHINLVYGAALRLVGGDTHLAQDVVQTVFTDLSLRAASLVRCVSLAGWLYRHTFFIASSIVRKEQRRRHRERQAAQMNEPNDLIPPNWDRLSPILDEVVQGLGTADREAIVLRYFQGRDLKSVGDALGTNEDAAQKRVARALEKLRARLVRRGVALTASALALAMTHRAATAAPLDMAAHVTGSIMAGTWAGSGATLTWIKWLAWLKTKNAIASCAVVLLAGITATYRFESDSKNLRSDFGKEQAVDGAALAKKTSGSEGATDRRFGFQWSRVESSDYREYIARLRAIGCPEEVLRDIIVADVNQTYAARMQAVWKWRANVYWKKNRNLLGPDQVQQLRALDQEKAGIVKALLGISIDPRDMEEIDLRLREADMQFLFLPADRREAARRALDESGIDARIERMREANPRSDPEREQFDERLKVLAKILSPEELDEFRMRGSPKAQWLRGEVQYLDCSPEDFKTLLDLRERHLGPASQRLTVDRETAIEDVRNLFGEERASEYTRVSDHGYTNTRQAAERLGLPSDLADQVGQIGFEARVAVEQTITNTLLTVAERQRRVSQLQTRAEAQLDAALGNQASIGIRQALRGTLANTAQLIRP